MKSYLCIYHVCFVLDPEVSSQPAVQVGFSVYRMRSSSSLYMVVVSLVLCLCLFVPNDQFVLAKGVHLFNVGTTWDQPASHQLVQTRSKPDDDFQKRFRTLVRTSSRIDNVMKIRGGVVISKGKKVRMNNGRNPPVFTSSATRTSSASPRLVIISYSFPDPLFHYQLLLSYFALILLSYISPRKRVQ